MTKGMHLIYVFLSFYLKKLDNFNHSFIYVCHSETIEGLQGTENLVV